MLKLMVYRWAVGSDNHATIDETEKDAILLSAWKQNVLILACHTCTGDRGFVNFSITHVNSDDF